MHVVVQTVEHSSSSFMSLVPHETANNAKTKSKLLIDSSPLLF